MSAPQPARHAEPGVQRPVGTRPFGVREAAGPGDAPDDKRRQGVGQPDGAGTGQLPRQMRLHRPGKSTLFQMPMKRAHPPKGVTARGAGVSWTWAFPKRGVTTGRIVLFLSDGVVLGSNPFCVGVLKQNDFFLLRLSG